MSEFEPIEFEIQIDASKTIDHVPILDMDEKFIEEYVSVQELSTINKHTVPAVKTIVDYGCGHLNAAFNDAVSQLKSELEREFGATKVFSSEADITSPRILDNGDVRLYGECVIFVKIKSAEWDRFYQRIDQIVGDAIARAIDDDKFGVLYDILL